MIRLIRTYLTWRNRVHYYRLRVSVWVLKKYVREGKVKDLYLTNQIGWS